jgi:predicted transport protein
MALFSINNGNVRKIPPIKIGLERNIQKIFEENLNEILNITFLATEYSTSFGGRIDSLGIDNNGAPVIIEYKKKQNNNVINQGLSYLRWLLDHKADFNVLVQKAKIDMDIDWDSPRVICVAESYNKFDLDTADLLPMKIELLKYRIYENGILLVESETQQKIRISTSKVFDQKETSILKERKQYTVGDHLKIANKNIKDIFAAMKEMIVALDEAIIEEPKAKYIAYKLTTNFVDVVVFKDFLKLFFNVPSGKLDDPHGIARDLAKPKKIGHWGNGDYEAKISNKDDIGNMMELIKQSYLYNK